MRGFSDLLEGDAPRADSLLAEAIDVGRASPDTGLVIGLAARGFCAIDRDDWNAVEAHLDEALAIVQKSGLDDYAELAGVFVLAARRALRQGDHDLAREYLTRTARLRPMLTYARPALSTHALIELARAYIRAGDTAAAREVLRQAREILHKRPDLGVLPKEIEALEVKLESMDTGRVGASSLTAAELRLIPLLSTHLTFPQIGTRLHVSRHTVKSQAISIYQKLGVSSRAEAIDRLEEIGLLES